MPHITVAELEQRLKKKFVAHGFEESDAAAIVDEIVFAELRHKRSHGLNMVETMMDRLHKSKGRPAVIMDKGDAVLLEGNGIAGPIVSRLALDLLSKRLNDRSIAIIGVRNSSPFLTAGHFVWKAAKEHGLVSLVASVAKAKVTPFNGARPVFGTNPIGFGFPADPEPVVVDMAVTEIPAAELDMAERENRELPEHVALDRNGIWTTNPAAAKKGSLVTFGGYKGAALAVIVELLVGAFLGVKCGLRLGDMRGMIFIGLRGDTFTPLSEIKRAAQMLRDDVGGSGRLGQLAPRLPGDSSSSLYRSALERGIDITDSEFALLNG